MVLLRRGRLARLTPLAEISAGGDATRVFGTRAALLAEAQRFGVPIVPTFVLPAAAFEGAVRAALPPAHDTASLLRGIDRQAGVERAARARERLLELPFDAAVADDLASIWRDEGAHAPWGLLVSASPTCPDDTVATLAGLDETVHGVTSETGLGEAIRHVWSCALHEDALRVLRAHRVRELGVGVVIQRIEVTAAHGRLLVQPPRAAPMVSLDDLDPAPSSSAQPTMAIASCALGLAAPVVDGVGARDLARLTDDGQLVQTELAAKSHALIVTGAGPELRETEANEAARFSLSPEASAHLWQLADELGQLGWGSLAADFLVTTGGVVQAAALRRATGRAAVPGGQTETVWSRVALAEELPTAITPLTWSILEPLGQGALRSALAEIGGRLGRTALAAQRVASRPYLNLSVLFAALAQVPGVDPVVLPTSVRGPAAEQLARELDQHRPQRGFVRLPLAAARTYAARRKLEARVRRWERDLEPQRRWFAELDLAILPDDALVATLGEARQRCDRTLELWLHGSVALLQSQLLLEQVIARSTPVGAARTAALITSGVGSLASAEPGAALLGVMAVVRQDEAARRVLLERPVAAVAELPHGPARRALAHFLDAFGDRGIREAELSSPRFSEQPRAVLAMVTAGLRHEGLDPGAALSYVRVQADAALMDLEARLPLVDSALLRALATQARSLLLLRERMRTSAARALAILREVVRDVGRRLQRLDPTLRSDSVFFATIDELRSAMSELRGDLGAITRLRQAAFERHTAQVDPAESFVGLPPLLELSARKGSAWHGVPCCGGLVVGRARVVGPNGAGADQLRPGEILVIRTADVALSPLVVMAAGVVTEAGSAWASGSVVAREHGVPMVTGVTGATTTVRDGDRLRVDGDHGLVERMVT